MLLQRSRLVLRATGNNSGLPKSLLNLPITGIAMPRKLWDDRAQGSGTHKIAVLDLMMSAMFH
jgi:hypothetical protein